MIATLGEAHDLGWRLRIYCRFGKRDGMKEVPPEEADRSRQPGGCRVRGQDGGLLSDRCSDLGERPIERVARADVWS